MPSKPRKKATIYAEVAPVLKHDLARAAAGAGRTLTEELELAIRRHLAYPPPAETIPPLPDGNRAKKKSREKSPPLP